MQIVKKPRLKLCKGRFVGWECGTSWTDAYIDATPQKAYGGWRQNQTFSNAASIGKESEEKVRPWLNGKPPLGWIGD